MKAASALITLLATTATATNLGFSVGGAQDFLGGNFNSKHGGVSVNAKLDVPGENPLEFCEDTKDYILEITNVDLNPNPPKAGESLSIKATGDIIEEIEDGAYVFIEVKYGLIKILSLKEDLCDQMKNVDKDCPLKKGEQTLTKDVDLPSRVPPGKYSVKADVYTKNDEKITCLQTTIEFK